MSTGREYAVNVRVSPLDVKDGDTVRDGGRSGLGLVVLEVAIAPRALEPFTSPYRDPHHQELQCMNDRY